RDTMSSSHCFSPTSNHHSVPTRRSSDLQAYPTILGLPQTVLALKTQVNNANTALSQFEKATGLDTTLLASFLDYFTETLEQTWEDRKSTRLNSSHVSISYAVSCFKKKTG